MNRSRGVTASAVVVFIGSGFALLAALITALALAITPRTVQQPELPIGMTIGILVSEAGFAVWGIVSGIGLLGLRQWARISVLVFSGFLLLATVPALVIVPAMPMPHTADMPDNFYFFMKMFLVLIYAIPAAIGTWWLFFFNKRSVKDQFRGMEAGVSALSSPQATERPISILIIGWFMVIGACMTLPMPLLHFPMIFMGLLLTSWRGALLIEVWCAAQLIAAIGLLKFRAWGRTLSICILLFGILNVLVTLLLPGRDAKIEEVLAIVQERMGLPITSPVVFRSMMHFSFWAGLFLATAVIAVELWFVVTRKQAFYRTGDIAA